MNLRLKTHIAKFENNLHKAWAYELLITLKMLTYKLCLLIFQKFIVYVAPDERICSGLSGHFTQHS